VQESELILAEQNTSINMVPNFDFVVMIIFIYTGCTSTESIQLVTSTLLTTNNLLSKYYCMLWSISNRAVNWLAGRFGLYSGCTINSMWGNPVPKYAPSV